MQVINDHTLHAGQVAPNFILSDQDGEMHTLSEYRGTWVLLYFYPKDCTTDCVKEACGLRDHTEEFKRAGIKILGVSADSAHSHKHFRELYTLPFPLFVDTHGVVAEQYGAFVPGQLADGEILRASFLIDATGNVEKIYWNVNPATHAKQVLADLVEIKKEDEEGIQL
jgi:peroxiredoxin Q/BCP